MTRRFTSLSEKALRKALDLEPDASVRVTAGSHELATGRQTGPSERQGDCDRFGTQCLRAVKKAFRAGSIRRRWDVSRPGLGHLCAADRRAVSPSGMVFEPAAVRHLYLYTLCAPISQTAVSAVGRCGAAIMSVACNAAVGVADANLISGGCRIVVVGIHACRVGPRAQVRRKPLLRADGRAATTVEGSPCRPSFRYDIRRHRCKRGRSDHRKSRSRTISIISSADSTAFNADGWATVSISYKWC
jgi:hypothetical protein